VWLKATHQAVISGIFDGNTLCEHHLDMRIVEVAGRESHTGPDKVDKSSRDEQHPSTGKLNHL